MQLPAANGLQELRMTPRSSCRLGPLVGDPLREVENPLAVDEHRGAALLEMQPARIDLAEMREQLSVG